MQNLLYANYKNRNANAIDSHADDTTDQRSIISEQLALGDKSFSGDGVEKNYQQASEYYKKVGSQNADPRAAALANLRLGLIYFTGGLRGRQNRTEALNYFKKAASIQGGPEEVAAVADYYTGKTYFDGGLGLTPNEAQARIYYNRAANQTADMEAMIRASLNLGMMYHYGKGGEPDRDTARSYYEKVSNQNERPWAKAQAQNLLRELDKLDQREEEEATEILRGMDKRPNRGQSGPSSIKRIKLGAADE